MEGDHTYLEKAYLISYIKILGSCQVTALWATYFMQIVKFYGLRGQIYIKATSIEKL